LSNHGTTALRYQPNIITFKDSSPRIYLLSG
jgi:hypothetical protein